MTPEELDALRRDPQNQKWGLYYCKEDPRVIVPKRFKWMGWTINAARPGAILVVLFTFAMVLVPVCIVRASGGGNGAVLGTIAASAAVVCLFFAYLSSEKRWNR